MLNDDILHYIENHREEAYELLLTLARIPAPSNHEEKRAQFCRQWLEDQGAEGVYVDDALNVVYPVEAEGGVPLRVFMAHTDVVFPDEEELPLRVENGRIYCPGVGDDTACLVCVLLVAKYIAKQIKTPAWKELRGQDHTGLLLVCNSGEEGLGNLKGVRKICETYGDRMESFCCFDSSLKKLVNRAVGSKRFQVGVRTRGGHSYSDFGNDNAIAKLSAIITKLYETEVPAQGGKTTYNLGVISGGTSVNTIAQEAHVLYEFRSESRESLDYMEQKFMDVIGQARAEGLDVSVDVIGLRPCGGDVDEEREQALVERAARAVSSVTGITPQCNSGSTDCNIPLSMGIPSVCVGSYTGAGSHTREEYVEIDTLAQGYQVAFEMILGK